MKFIPATITRNAGRSILTLQKNSPRLFFVAGVAGVITSTVLACKATLKLSDDLDEIKNEVDAVKELKDKATNGNYPDHEYYRDLSYVYMKSGIRIARLYAPSVVIGTTSLVALTTSHVTLSRRNAALTAAYAAVSKSYDEYRDRVRKELGEEKELDIYHAAYDEHRPDTKEIVKVADPNRFSPYARFFDEYNRNWKKNAELNKLFIQCQQNYANHILHARGHIFLNEVYDMLGIERCQAGQVVGWVVGDNGDNYIDFGMFDAVNSEFVNGYERSIILDFNVDGVIFNKI